MDYAREVREFNRQAKMRGIAASDRVLWMALLDYAYEGGADTFSVLTSRLASDTQLSERTIYNARERLQEEGFITFEQHGNGKTCTYTVHQLCKNVSEPVSDLFPTSFRPLSEPFPKEDAPPLASPLSSPL